MFSKINLNNETTVKINLYKYSEDYRIFIKVEVKGHIINDNDILYIASITNAVNIRFAPSAIILDFNSCILNSIIEDIDIVLDIAKNNELDKNIPIGIICKSKDLENIQEAIDNTYIKFDNPDIFIKTSEDEIVEYITSLIRSKKPDVSKLKSELEMSINKLNALESELFKTNKKE